MKKLFALVALLVATFTGSYAATVVTLDADLRAALPSKDTYLPGPPEVGSPVWLDDSTKYFYYKEIGNRFDNDKGECWDSAWALMNEPYDFALYRVSADSVMNAPFIDVTLTRVTPGKYTVEKTHNTTDYPEMNKLWELCVAMKEANTESRERPRPYKYFGYWYKGKKYTVDRDDATSYPSGHGYFAGLFKKCMIYIDPADSVAITNMMDEWAHCRLLLGAHWNTDVIDGKQLGEIAFNIAMNYPQFRNQLEAAKAEWVATHTFQRVHPHMNLNSLCYPYQINDYSGATFYTMLYKEVDSNGDPINVYLQEHQGVLEAGKPYFYLPEDGSAELVCHFSGKETAAGTDGNGVYGVYDDLTPVEPGMYVTYNNRFTKAGTNVQLSAYRVYVDMSQVSTNPQGPAYIPGRRILKISNLSDAATDIQIITPANQSQNTKVLQDGQLIIYMDDNRYNAAGQKLQ